MVDDVLFLIVFVESEDNVQKNPIRFKGVIKNEIYTLGNFQPEIK